MNVRAYIVKSIRECVSKNASKREGEKECIIDYLIDKFKLYYNRPVSSITEMNQRENRKIKGDVFEMLAKMYFETTLWKGVALYSDVWLLNEVPDEVLKELGLKRRDLGIDLVLKHRVGTDNYSAVQVKYRVHTGYRSKNVIGWKALSTFYALVKRTGPWKKYIIFTNADYVRHVGKRETRDKTIAIGTLRNIKSEHWYRMCETRTGSETSSGNTVGGENEIKKMTKEQIREARLKAFS